MFACLSGQAVCLLNANEPKEGEHGCKPTNLDFAQKRQNRIKKKGGGKRHEEKRNYLSVALRFLFSTGKLAKLVDAIFRSCAALRISWDPSMEGFEPV